MHEKVVSYRSLSKHDLQNHIHIMYNEGSRNKQAPPYSEVKKKTYLQNAETQHHAQSEINVYGVSP